MQTVFGVFELFLPFLFPFINHFHNLTANPRKREKRQKDADFIERRMIRENNNVKHREEQHYKANQNRVSYFSVLHDNRRKDTSNGRTQS